LRRVTSVSRIEQPPCHGANFIEGLKGFLGLLAADRAGRREKSQMAVDLFGRCVGNTPEVQTVSDSPGDAHPLMLNAAADYRRCH
jgi:hypothetical protein